MARGLLVSWAGYPYTPSSFALDNGLANLAGALVAEGHQALIADFGTLSVMRRLFPAGLAARVAPVMQQLLTASGPPPPEAGAQLAALTAELEAHQQAETLRVGDELAALVRQWQPDFVGFKLWNGDGFSGSLTLAARLREEFPSLKLYAGGPHATWFQGLVYDHTTVFDALAVGEGESTIVALAEHAAGRLSLAEVPGIIYREGAVARENPPAPYLNMNALPDPLYDEDIYPAIAGDEKLKIVVVDDSRGCPHACGFCTHPLESGQRLRLKSATRLADDLQRIITRYGLHAFRFAGSTTPGSLMADTAHQILDRGLKLVYTSFGHFRSTEPEHFPLLRRSGLWGLFFGIETGCQELLEKAVGKGRKLYRVRETVQDAQAAGIFVACSMIVPMPFETEETLQRSLDFLLEIRPDSVPVQFPGLLPLTPWLMQPERYGIEVDRDRYLHENIGYKFKLLLPPAFWQPLPYRINGLDYHQFTAQTAAFARQLEQAGILVNLSDDNAMIARLAGMGYREYRDAARVWCVTGNAEAMQEMVCRANHALGGDPTGL